MDPIVLEFEVQAGPEHAFKTWTEKCALWWPRSHCMSQADGFDVVFEPFVGGRIYERGPDGAEYDWGEVTVWDEPDRVEYRWHIFLESEKATTVVVTFTGSGGGTIVRLENSGFEVFGDGAEERTSRVESAWGGIVQHYRDVVSEST